MRRTILAFIIITTAAVNAYAQPRTMGARLGVTGLEAAYQHTMNKNQFIEGNLGLDFGTLGNGKPGIKASALYNFIWARPAWTDRGSWALYAGPGASIGYVNETVVYKTSKHGEILASPVKGGFMLGAEAQVGLEYTFWFPLQLSVDMRPTIGMHVSGGHSVTDPVTGTTVRYDPKVSLYEGGLLGFIPTISARYVF